MCYICKSSPHTVGCPFYKSPSSLKCSVCGNSIYKGQKYFDFESEQIHKQCIGDLSSAEILDLLNITPSVN